MVRVTRKLCFWNANDDGEAWIYLGGVSCPWKIFHGPVSAFLFYVYLFTCNADEEGVKLIGVHFIAQTVLNPYMQLNLHDSREMVPGQSSDTYRGSECYSDAISPPGLRDAPLEATLHPVAAALLPLHSVGIDA